MAGRRKQRKKEKDPRGKHRTKQISKTKINLTCRRLGFCLITIKKSAVRPMALSTINQVTHFSIVEPLRDQILNWFFLSRYCQSSLCLCCLYFIAEYFGAGVLIIFVVVVGGDSGSLSSFIYLAALYCTVHRISIGKPMHNNTALEQRWNFEILREKENDFFYELAAYWLLLYVS